MGQSEIDAVRALLSSKPRPVGWAARRRRIEEVGSVWPIAGDIRLEEAHIDGFPAEWSIAPGSDASRVLMFFHGGGYCSGSILSHRRLVTEAGRAAGTRTLAMNTGWRLSILSRPRSTTHSVLGATSGRMELPPRQIAVGGDSAGGGLTLALITSLRDAKQELPGCAWLVSPWTDLTMSGETLATKDAVDPIIHKPYLGELADAYLPARMDRKDPRVSALYADLRGLPAGTDPGGVIRNAAVGFHTLCRRGRRRRCAGHPGDLAAHDPRLADVERTSGARTPRARQRERVHPPSSSTHRACTRVR